MHLIKILAASDFLVCWSSPGEYENQEWPRVPDRKISVEGDMLWHNPNRGISRGLDVKACRPRLISSDLEREVILDSFSRLILTIKCILLAFLQLFDAKHIFLLYLHGIKKSSDKTFLSTLISSSNIETNNQYYKITCKCVTWLFFSYRNYVVCLNNLYELCNATATTARCSFDVAGKIAFVLWRHGQRRNGTMPTMGLALLCLLLQESARIPRARSPSRIERSRTRLPVGLHSLMCEND